MEYFEQVGILENILSALFALVVVLFIIFLFNYFVRIKLKEKKREIESDIVYLRTHVYSNQLRVFLGKIEEELKETNENNRVRKLIELWTWLNFIRDRLYVISDLQNKLDEIGQWIDKDEDGCKSFAIEYERLTQDAEEGESCLVEYKNKVQALHRKVFKKKKGGETEDEFFKVSY